MLHETRRDFSMGTSMWTGDGTLCLRVGDMVMMVVTSCAKVIRSCIRCLYRLISLVAVARVGSAA